MSFGEEKGLRIMQAFSTYQPFIDKFYKDNVQFISESSDVQTRALLNYGFFAVHAIVPHLDSLGHTTEIVFANSPQLQFAWAHEQGVHLQDTTQWENELLKARIEHFKPDILYNFSPYKMDPAFRKSLKHNPRIVTSWRCATVEQHWDWSCYDILLTSLPSIQALAPQLGAKKSVIFAPGYPVSMIKELATIPQDIDVVFVGTLTGPRRIATLDALAKGAAQHGYSLALHLSGSMNALTPAMRPYLCPQVFGNDTLRALRRGKIVIDARGGVFLTTGEGKHIKDIGEDTNCSMRLLEATGGGSMVLALNGHSPWFTWNNEIIPYSGPSDIIDKVCYYLKNDNERMEIAMEGQKKCITEFNIKSKAADFIDTVQKNLHRPHKTAHNIQYQPNKVTNIMNTDTYTQEDYTDIYTKILSNTYLHESGWFKSYIEQKVIDGAGNPLPWMNYPMISFLEERVPAGLTIFEYGCGFGTLWWAKKAKRVVTVEHNKIWYESMLKNLPDNVRAIFRPLETGGEYCKTVAQIQNVQFNIIIIDGRDRVNCALHCAPSLADDGVIIFDDTDREAYIDGRTHLKNIGFKELKLTGIKPMVLSVGTSTSLFYKNNNCLGI